MPRTPVGIHNGNFRNGAYHHFDRAALTSPRDDVLSALKARMSPGNYRHFFDTVYSKYRWSDAARYERILRYMLARLEREDHLESRLAAIDHALGEECSMETINNLLEEKAELLIELERHQG